MKGDQAEPPAGDRLLRARRRPRLQLRRRPGAQLVPRQDLTLFATASRIRSWASRRGSRQSAPAARAEGPLGLPRAGRLLRKRQPDRQRAGHRGVRAGPPARARQRGPARCGRDHRDEPRPLGRRRRRGSRARPCWTRARRTRPAGWRRCNIFLRQYPAADSAADRAVGARADQSRDGLPQGAGHRRPGRSRQRSAVIRAAARRIDPRRCSPSSPITRISTGCSTTRSSGRCSRRRRARSTTTGGAGASCAPSSITSAAIAVGPSPTPTRRGSRSRSRAGPRPRTGSATCCSGSRWRTWGERRTRCARDSGAWS